MYALSRLDQIMDEVFDKTVVTDNYQTSIFRTTDMFRLPIDIADDGKNYIVYAELAGAGPEDVNISVDGNRLTISYNKKKNDNENNTTVIGERKFGKFSRSIILHEAVDKAKISASMKNGLLTVTLPKDRTEISIHIEQ